MDDFSQAKRYARLAVLATGRTRIAALNAAAACLRMAMPAAQRLAWRIAR